MSIANGVVPNFWGLVSVLKYAHSPKIFKIGRLRANSWMLSKFMSTLFFSLITLKLGKMSTGMSLTQVWVITRVVMLFIISSTVILAADWSIAVGYWIVFHCFSLNVNARIRISVLSSLSVFYPTSPWQLWV